MANTPIKPGTDNQKPGRYVEVGPRGGKVANGHTATIEKGDRLPPTSAKGNGWKKSLIFVCVQSFNGCTLFPYTKAHSKKINLNPCFGVIFPIAGIVSYIMVNHFIPSSY